MFACRFSEAELAAERVRNNPQGAPAGDFSGRCAACHSTDLWEDNLAYGCNHCGVLLATNDTIPLLWPDGQGAAPRSDATQVISWAVYDRPSDCPDHFVARLFVLVEGGAFPTEFHVLCLAIEPLRAYLRAQGLTRVGRSVGDPPGIVETWM